MLEQAIDDYIDTTRDDRVRSKIWPRLNTRTRDFVANLADSIAPLTELVSLPLTSDNKVTCPFHDDAEPSCTIYPDHFYCFGCGEQRQPARLADAGRGHDRGRGRSSPQRLARAAGPCPAKRR